MKTNKKVLLIINPVSGDGAARLWMNDMISVLSDNFGPITVFLSRAAGDISKIAAVEAGNYDILITTGGDGSMSELLDGVVKSGASPLLGFIPMGTINDFANSHGISRNVKTALKTIVGMNEHIYDVGVLGDRAFSYVAAFGAFTDVAYQTPQDSKSSFGILAYLSEAAKRLPKLKPIKMTYEIDGKTEAGEFIYGMVSNSKSVGGIKFFGVMGDDMLRDGMSEVTLVRFPNTPDELFRAIRGLLDPKAKCDNVLRMRVSKIGFSFGAETPWTVDGEYGGKFKDVCAFVIPDRIRIIH